MEDLELEGRETTVAPILTSASPQLYVKPSPKRVHPATLPRDASQFTEQHEHSSQREHRDMAISMALCAEITALAKNSS